MSATEHKVTWEGNRLEIQMPGELNIDSLIAMLREVYADPRHEDVTQGLIDFTKVTSFQLSDEDIAFPLRAFLSQQTVRPTVIHRAYIVRDPKIREFVEKFSGHIKKFTDQALEVEFFDSKQEAADWLQTLR